MSKGQSWFRWQRVRVWKQKLVKGTPLPPQPTCGFLQWRRKLQVLHHCCWDHGDVVQLLTRAVRGAALKLEIKVLYNPSFPFQNIFFSNEEANVRLDSLFMKCSPEMECSILRIATYHKGLEGCDGFQNLFVICMRLLVKGEKSPSAPAAAAAPAHPGVLGSQGAGGCGCRQHGLQEGAKVPQVPSSPPSSMRHGFKQLRNPRIPI